MFALDRTTEDRRVLGLINSSTKRRAHARSTKWGKASPLILRHQGDGVTALLTTKGQQLGMRAKLGFASLQLHRSAAQFATGREQRRCEG